jgi:aminopeptidase N
MAITGACDFADDRNKGGAAGRLPSSRLNLPKNDLRCRTTRKAVQRDGKKRGSIRRILPAALAAVVFICLPTRSLATRHERLVEQWKPVHYEVALTFNDQLTEISRARAAITIVALKDQVGSIDLDFGEMIVDSVQVNSHSARFVRLPELLKVQADRPAAQGTRLVIVVFYHGKPKDGLMMTNDKDAKPTAVGDNWPNRVHHWIPCLDHPSAKATVTFTVTAPTRDLVVANGKLERVQTTTHGARTWTYTEHVPIPPYCMIVGVGEFAKLAENKSATTSLSYYVPQSDGKFAEKGFAPAAPSLKLFGEIVEAYPYEKLALIIGATRFGGMENSSAIVFSSNLFDPTLNTQLSKAFGIRIGIVDVVAHEIAHQWFGDSVTESTWSDLWLSEGFATYFAGLFIERHEGKEAFQNYLAQAAETYFRYEQKTRTPIFDDQTEDLFKLLNPNNYQKGAWVLHMLRSMLGDEAFFRGIRSYYKAHKDSTATSEDLRRALEEASGFKLEKFFVSWVYGSGHPQYELSWEWDSERRMLKVHLNQLQAEPAFCNWLPVDVITPNGKQRVVFKPEGKKTVAELRLDQAPVSIQADPENTVLKEISVK